MTKLMEWLLGLSLIGILWSIVTFDLLDLRISDQYLQVAWPLPIYLLVTFGCYSLAVVGYRVATFNDCEAAAKELQEQIQDAKRDLQKKGLHF
ncbi:dolichol-phosphate mannosyltransferase subunit 3 [Erpetoichthys calabaricus]|uniref:Dolichol-phosphate mannosyltransferase subunit 3 n=1 Tax=Erpetoichthys calabaricus TaxID=27687 RepID=A0A8C4X5U6_ERPCA|nr:dolichol-phosphate mannosyltransferase subunit 3 [Erpetoichthys calabaricus]